MPGIHNCLLMKGPRNAVVSGAARACSLAYLQGAIALADTLREMPRDSYFDDQFMSLPDDVRSRLVTHFTEDDFLALDYPSLSSLSSVLAGATPGGFLDACVQGWNALCARPNDFGAVAVADPDSPNELLLAAPFGKAPSPHAGHTGAVGAMIYAGLNHYLGIRVCTPVRSAGNGTRSSTVAAVPA